MMVNLLTFALAAALLAAVAYRWREVLRTWTRGERLAAGLLAAAIVCLSLLSVNLILGTVGMDWNAARLTPAFALVTGYDLYYPATSGPILDHVYGPVGALALLPATVFRTPTPAILAAGFLQLLYVYGAMLFFAWRAGDGSVGERLRALTCGVGACLLMVRYPSTSYWISMVHPDAPSLALGLLACTMLVSSRDAPPSRRALFASATAAVLSCWTKQTVAPLPVALVLAVWLAHGRATALRYGLLLAATGIAFSVLFLVWFGHPLIFNMFFMVRDHPWMKPGVGGLLATIGGFLWDIREILAMLLVTLTVASLSTAERQPLAARPWFPPLLAALFLIPTGALGMNKVLGSPNSFHSAYYAIAAAVGLLADIGRYSATGRALASASCALGMLAAWQAGWDTRYSRPELWRNNNQVAYEFALRHPGEAYFPWQPLASLLAEGRLYHFEHGILDRFIGGNEPTREHVLAGTPPRLRWVAARHAPWSLRFFPELSSETQLAELPGWMVWARRETAGSSALSPR